MDIRGILLTSKILYLTPFQANMIIGYAQPDQFGQVNIKEFSFKCKELIGEMFTIKAL